MSEVIEIDQTDDPQHFVTPGYGDTMLELMHYRQALRVGDRVDISGQGGWDDDISFPESLPGEAARAFDNVGRTLAQAGATWDDVVAVESFHVPTAPDFIGDEHHEAMVEQLRKHLGDRPPIWTQVGVAALGARGMRVEVRVQAVVRR